MTSSSMGIRLSANFIVFMSFLFLSENRLSWSADVPLKNPASVISLADCEAPTDLSVDYVQNEILNIEKNKFFKKQLLDMSCQTNKLTRKNKIISV
ncbi:hypothetical protein BpHYR1_007747 [Brachionus plicatilis]|uniref:Uncharacterized protein n=1 Tax=Brachionus plicatilis TaxID=10195 RepID=A0A3M7RP90_BRAPC|nr:hypothetical protein BpHYR1_007747 [Brachionus plicatilis]